MNLYSIFKSIIVFLIGLVIVYIGLALTQSAECGIAVALVYLAAINAANNVYGEKK